MPKSVVATLFIVCQGDAPNKVDLIADRIGNDGTCQLTYGDVEAIAEMRVRSFLATTYVIAAVLVPVALNEPTMSWNAERTCFMDNPDFFTDDLKGWLGA